MSSETEIIDNIVEDAVEWNDNNSHDDIGYSEEDLLADELRREESERQEQPVSGIIVVYSDPPDRPTTVMKGFSDMGAANEYIDTVSEDSPTPKEHFKTGYVMIERDE